MRRGRPILYCGAAVMLAAQPWLLSAAMAQGRLGGGQPLEVSLGRILAALIICLIIAGLAILVIRQRGGRTDVAAWFARFEVRSRAIEVVETRRLSQHADVCVIRHRGIEYLLLLMAGDARVLSERSSHEESGEARQG